MPVRIVELDETLNFEEDGKGMKQKIVITRALLLSLEKEDEDMAILCAKSFLALDNPTLGKLDP